MSPYQTQRHQFLQSLLFTRFSNSQLSALSSPPPPPPHPRFLLAQNCLLYYMALSLNFAEQTVLLQKKKNT